jgi:hypothetical protein
MVNMLLLVPFHDGFMVPSNLHIILQIYPSFIYKIELVNFGGRIVENTYALPIADFTLFVAKLNCLILLPAVRRCKAQGSVAVASVL